MWYSENDCLALYIMISVLWTFCTFYFRFCNETFRFFLVTCSQCMYIPCLPMWPHCQRPGLHVEACYWRHLKHRPHLLEPCSLLFCDSLSSGGLLQCELFSAEAGVFYVRACDLEKKLEEEKAGFQATVVHTELAAPRLGVTCSDLTIILGICFRSLVNQSHLLQICKMLTSDFTVQRLLYRVL